MNVERYQYLTDTELLENFYLDPDNQWLGTLLQRYTLLLFGVCMKYLKNEDEAKDSVQQIFLKIITELPKYRVTYFKSWMYMVAKNYCLMKLRDRHGRLTTDITDQIGGIMAEEQHQEKAERFEKDKKLQLMDDALKELSIEQKSCLTLFYLEKKSYQEIVVQTGYSMLKVKSYIQNGKRNLKILLDKKLNS